MSAKLGLVLSLARNRRLPKRPSEPRPSGINPKEDGVERRRYAPCMLCGQFDCRDVTGITEREITSAYNLVSIYFLISECKTAKRLDCE